MHRYPGVSLDVIAHGARGHAPVHLLLISAAEIGFVWDGVRVGWIRSELPPAQDAFWSVHRSSKSSLSFV